MDRFQYEGGIVDFVSHVNASKEALFAKVGYYEDRRGDEEVEIAFQWNTGFNTDGLHSFANGITTVEGGMHEQGFRSALTRTVNKYARDKNLLKEKETNLTGEDMREGLTAIISVRLQDPQFEGQTKAKLGNVSVRSMVEKATNETLAEWLEENPPRPSRSSRRRSLPRRPAWPPERPRTHPPQDRARRRRHARQAQGLLIQGSARVRAVHRRGRLRRWLGDRGSRPATRRSCPSAARSSTSSGPASTRC